MRMNEVRRYVVGAAGALLVLLVTSGLAIAQNDSRYRVLSPRIADVQKALDGLRASGERVLLGDAGVGVFITEKADAPRTYLYAEELERFITSKKIPAGFALMPHTLSSTPEGRFRAVFEKLEGDERLRDYRLIKGGNSEALEQQIDKVFADGYGLVGVVAGGGDVAAVLERTPAPPLRWTLIGTARTGTMQKELEVRKAFRIVNGFGEAEAVYGLVEAQNATDYLVISTVRSETLGNELNAAVEKGYRFVPGTLLAVVKKFLGKPVTDPEMVVIMERRGDVPPVAYSVLGIRRISTLERELADATAQGFVPITYGLGFRETVVILEKPRGVTR